MPHFRTLNESQQIAVLKQYQAFVTAAAGIRDADSVVVFRPVVLNFLRLKGNPFSTDAVALEQLLDDCLTDFTFLHFNINLWIGVNENASNILRQVLKACFNQQGDSFHDSSAFYAYFANFHTIYLLPQSVMNKPEKMLKFITKTSRTSRDDYEHAIRVARTEKYQERQRQAMFGGEEHAWTGAELFLCLSASVNGQYLQQHLEKKRGSHPTETLYQVNIVLAALRMVINAASYRNVPTPKGYEPFDKVWDSLEVMSQIVRNRVFNILKRVKSADFLLCKEGGLDDFEHLVNCYDEVARLCYRDLFDLLLDVYQNWLRKALMLVEPVESVHVFRFARDN